MKRTKSISELLAGLYKGKLSSGESEQLFSAFRDEVPSDAANEFYNQEWKNSRSNSKIAHPANLLTQIHLKTGINITGPVNRNRFTWMKYAAVILMTFLSGWFLNQLMQSEKRDTAIAGSPENIVTVPYGSKSEIQLPDGSKVKLNSGSKLSYPSVFNPANRIVKLEGEGYFDVAKDPDKPFYVNTSNISIKVLGTVFNVKSYPEENIIETTLVSGAVEIYGSSAGPGNNQSVPLAALKPNEKATYIKDASKLQIDYSAIPVNQTSQSVQAAIRMEKTNPELITSWKDDILKFNNERFANIAVKLERWYNVKINVQYEKLNDERFTGQFDKETIEQALDYMTLTEPFGFRINKNVITIYNK